MKFYKERSRYDNEAVGMRGETDNDYAKTNGNFDINIQEMDLIREGLQWIISRSNKKDLYDQKRVQMSKDIRTVLGEASTILRRDIRGATE